MSCCEGCATAVGGASASTGCGTCGKPPGAELVGPPVFLDVSSTATGADPAGRSAQRATCVSGCTLHDVSGRAITLPAGTELLVLQIVRYGNRVLAFVRTLETATTCGAGWVDASDLTKATDAAVDPASQGLGRTAACTNPMGCPIYETPDAGETNASFPQGRAQEADLQILETRGAWVKVRAVGGTSFGTEGWVLASDLVRGAETGAASQPAYALVSTGCLGVNVREAPRTDAAVVASDASHGAALVVRKTGIKQPDGEWWLVTTPSGVTGYARALDVSGTRALEPAVPATGQESPPSVPALDLTQASANLATLKDALRLGRSDKIIRSLWRSYGAASVREGTFPREYLARLYAAAGRSPADIVQVAPGEWFTCDATCATYITPGDTNSFTSQTTLPVQVLGSQVGPDGARWVEVTGVGLRREWMLAIELGERAPWPTGVTARVRRNQTSTSSDSANGAPLRAGEVVTMVKRTAYPAPVRFPPPGSPPGWGVAVIGVLSANGDFYYVDESDLEPFGGAGGGAEGPTVELVVLSLASARQLIANSRTEIAAGGVSLNRRRAIVSRLRQVAAEVRSNLPEAASELDFAAQEIEASTQYNRPGRVQPAGPATVATADIYRAQIEDANRKGRSEKILRGLYAEYVRLMGVEGRAPDSLEAIRAGSGAATGLSLAPFMNRFLDAGTIAAAWANPDALGRVLDTLRQIDAGLARATNAQGARNELRDVVSSIQARIAELRGGVSTGQATELDENLLGGVVNAARPATPADLQRWAKRVDYSARCTAPQGCSPLYSDRVLTWHGRTDVVGTTRDAGPYPYASITSVSRDGRVQIFDWREELDWDNRMGPAYNHFNLPPRGVGWMRVVVWSDPNRRSGSIAWVHSSNFRDLSGRPITAPNLVTTPEAVAEIERQGAEVMASRAEATSQGRYTLGGQVVFEVPLAQRRRIVAEVTKAASLVDDPSARATFQAAAQRITAATPYIERLGRVQPTGPAPVFTADTYRAQLVDAIQKGRSPKILQSLYNEYARLMTAEGRAPDSLEAIRASGASTGLTAGTATGQQAVTRCAGHGHCTVYDIYGRVHAIPNGTPIVIFTTASADGRAFAWVQTRPTQDGPIVVGWMDASDLAVATTPTAPTAATIAELRDRYVTLLAELKNPADNANEEAIFQKATDLVNELDEANLTREAYDLAVAADTRYQAYLASRPATAAGTCAAPEGCQVYDQPGGMLIGLIPAGTPITVETRSRGPWMYARAALVTGPIEGWILGVGFLPPAAKAKAGLRWWN